MTTEMKPLEWERRSHEEIAVGFGYAYTATRNEAFVVTIGEPWRKPVPGPYDGTIETAKQRCEEHRRKAIPPSGFDASFDGVPFNWATREGGEIA